MEFKDRLKILRAEKGISTTALAAQFGKSDTAVRMWETGRSKPDADTLINLAKYFDCSTDYLLGISDFENAQKQSKFIDEVEAINAAVSQMDGRCKAVVLELLQALCDYEAQFKGDDALVWLYFSGFRNAVIALDVATSDYKYVTRELNLRDVDKRELEGIQVSTALRNYRTREQSQRGLERIYEELSNRIEKKICELMTDEGDTDADTQE